MNLQEAKQIIVNKAEARAVELMNITGFIYRVRWLFNGANVECWSVQAQKWVIVQTFTK